MKDPAALFYIADWLTSTKEMKADERGWYLNLILHQYDKGSLPNDIEELANLADVRFSEYDLFKQKWQQVLKQKFSINESNRLENPKAKEILQKRQMFKDKRSHSGKIGYVIKFAKANISKEQEYLEYVKSNFNFEKNDTNNKQVLKQVLKDLLKLYRNENENENVSKEVRENIINFLNEKTGKKYRANSDKTKELIQARFNEGFELNDFKKVIDIKVKKWKDDIKMKDFLRPETLFSNKFEGYLNEDTRTINDTEEAERRRKAFI